MSPISQFIREFLLAVQFFTRIPVTGALADWVGYSPDLMRASAGQFPGVGLLTGVLAATAYWTVQVMLPDSSFSPFVAAAFSTVAGVLVTGAFHEDGLADVADGLGGGQDRESALAIMKDSRVGAFGALALVLAIATKLALLALLGSVEGLPAGLADWDEAPFGHWYVCMAIVTAHVVSRALPLLLIYQMPYAGDAAKSKSRPMAERIPLRSLVTGGAWCGAVLALAATAADPMNLAVALSFAVLAMLWMARLFKRRLEGVTGDCLGATQQVCEIAFYLGLAVSL